MKVFVSYSRRDGVVTRPMLELLDKHLRDVCIPFIHCLHGSNRRWEQLYVLKELLASHTLLLIESPAAMSSPWVRLEIRLARLLCRPLIRLRASDLGVAPSKAHSMAQSLEKTQRNPGRLIDGIKRVKTGMFTEQGRTREQSERDEWQADQRRKTVA